MLKYFTMFFDKCKHILKRNKSEFIGFLFGLILFSFLVVRYLSFQKPSNPPERNKIVLFISTSELEDSLKVFEPLMSKIPANDFGNIRYEIRDSNNLKIINTEIDIKRTLNNPNNNINVLKDLSKHDLNRFLNLIVYFNNNHLSFCKYLKESRAFVFDYRKIEIKNNSDLQYDLYRYIYYSINGTTYSTIVFKEMDKKGNIYLLAPSDAHIW